MLSSGVVGVWCVWGTETTQVWALWSQVCSAGAQRLVPLCWTWNVRLFALEPECSWTAARVFVHLTLPVYCFCVDGRWTDLLCSWRHWGLPGVPGVAARPVDKEADELIQDLFCTSWALPVLALHRVNLVYLDSTDFLGWLVTLETKANMAYQEKR